MPAVSPDNCEQTGPADPPDPETGRERTDPGRLAAESLMEQCPLGIAVFSPDGTLVRTNPALRDLFGTPGADYAVGAYNVLLDPLAHSTGADAAFRRAAGGETVRIAGQLLDTSSPENAWRTHGKTLRLDSDWFPMRDTSGRVGAVAVMLRGAVVEGPAPAPTDRGATDRERTILFVDDEPMIRQFAHTVLTAKGYHVILAEDGDEALGKYAKYAGRIGLVVLDLTMPRMTGQEVFKQLRKRHPDVYVLFSSGYSEEPSDQGEGVAGFLPKPYRPQELVDAVREAMEAR